MNIKTQLVNDKPVRYLDKDSEFWVVVCDLAVAADFSPTTLHRHVRNLDTEKTIVGSSNACAVPVEIALASIKNIMENSKWKRKRNNELTKNVVTFLERLLNPANKDIRIRFVVSTEEASTDLEDEDMATEKHVEKIINQEVVTPRDFKFMDKIIRFVGTEDVPEWVANDPVVVLHPKAKASKNYSRYLDKVRPEYKGSKKITTPGGPQTVTTLFELITIRHFAPGAYGSCKQYTQLTRISLVILQSSILARVYVYQSF